MQYSHTYNNVHTDVYNVKILMIGLNTWKDMSMYFCARLLLCCNRKGNATVKMTRQIFQANLSGKPEKGEEKIIGYLKTEWVQGNGKKY